MPSIKSLPVRKNVYTYIYRYTYIKIDGVGWPSHHYWPYPPFPSPPPAGGEEGARGGKGHTLRPEQATGDERWNTETCVRTAGLPIHRGEHAKPWRKHHAIDRPGPFRAAGTLELARAMPGEEEVRDREIIQI